MDCNVKLVCIYNCSAGNSGGCCVIKLASTFNVSHISAVKCESPCKNLFFSGSPYASNMNISSCKATRREITDWSYGNLFIKNNQATSVSYSTMRNNESPCSTIYNDNLVAENHLHHLNIMG
ncbi:hypothetical protein TVAG_425010 [Trichomonas vaginalis G3]|uniref:Uncharacterized protein n=1 Tax=Trichomonas vaginalis (strain ATCC PRA-98 / G3) TaxID=412133 RepID=A2F5F1_TRIV3|nr:hypothetical protein TVAGG3_0185560 [Trichomonas vaginalis G3]EAX99864.1 hypothetical protein TVAG_425010 [Trichomonas vaginalis G3]KAI5549614.1 hypothetical protein TVAGG3_0185560 [Trichomonas vaginalis G3]|eukprot:XP_001312794.1 hypothetical protein [Trichomonas vaginalis G3]